MLIFFYILAAGLLGTLGHWWNRYAQGRTEEGFFEYMSTYKANSIASIFSAIGSSSLAFASTPPDIEGRALMLVLTGVYAAGYMLDSKFNKGTPPSASPEVVLINREIEKTVTQIKKVDSKKDLNDILKDDK
jgi:hypothetical protein